MSDTRKRATKWYEKQGGRQNSHSKFQKLVRELTRPPDSPFYSYSVGILPSASQCSTKRNSEKEET